jgi:hypothetical protein
MRAEMVLLRTTGEANLDEKSDIQRLRDIENIVLSSNELLTKEVVPAIRILSFCSEGEIDYKEGSQKSAELIAASEEDNSEERKVELPNLWGSATGIFSEAPKKET